MQRNSFFLACLLICGNCFAQQYPFVHYTPKDGLVNSRVRRAYQDGKGRLYFLTFGGLSVYDGARFRNYTKQNGLGSDLVNDVIETGEDSLLIATNTGMINVLVRGRLSVLKTENGVCPTINSFYRHHDQSLYLCCDGGFYRLDRNRLIPLNTNWNFPSPAFEAAAGSENFILLARLQFDGFEGLYLYDIRSNRICDWYHGRDLWPVTNQKTGEIWINGSDSIYDLDLAALKQGKIILKKHPLAEIGEVPISSVLTRKNFFFANTAFKNKYILAFSEKGLPYGFPLATEITASEVKDVLFDNEKNIWLSSNGSGVYKIVPSQITMPLTSPVKAGTSIYSVYSSIHGTWYSSTSNRLWWRSGNQVKIYTSALTISPFIFFDDGRNLLAHDNKTIYESERRDQHDFLQFKKIFSLSDNIDFSSRVMKDPNGNIIAGTTHLLAIVKDDKLIFSLRLPANDMIEGLCVDKNGLLWVISRYDDPKLCRLHPEDPAHYLEILYDFNKEQVKGSPRCMVLDRKGFLWIGTRDDGLFKFRQEGKQLVELEHFFTGNGMTDNFITSLACDSTNNIIAGTQIGVDRIIELGNGKYQVQNLTKNNNYFSYANDIWVEAGNRAFARTLGRFLEITPFLPTMADRGPNLLLEEMKVNGATVFDKASLNYKQNNLSFLVAAPSFIDEKQIRYSYLLKGSGNNKWSDTTASNAVINLINLPPGKYELVVKAFFPSSSYQPSVLSYAFEITPAWWQTWWFRIIVGLLIIAVLIFGFRFYYNRRLEKQMALLEKKQAIEKERTRIATDMHDDLGAGLSRIKFLSETIGIKKQQQQPIEEDISKIREYSHEMIDKMGEIVWALNEKNDSLTDLLSYSRSYAVEYLSQAGIECEVKAPENFPIIFLSGEFRRNIYLVLKEALHNIVKHAQASQVKIRIETDQNLVIVIKDDGVGFDKNNLRPFSNGLSNMKKRMKDIGGSLEIKNENGVAVVLSAPMG